MLNCISRLLLESFLVCAVYEFQCDSSICAVELGSRLGNVLTRAALLIP